MWTLDLARCLRRVVGGSVRSTSSTQWALIVLNCPLGPLFPKLWNAADIVLLADGAANRVFDSMSSSERLK